MTVYYKDCNDLTKRDLLAFKSDACKPGEINSQEGIYRCKVCKITEIVLHKHEFPSHQHGNPLPEGSVEWELIIAHVS
jgi:hypothetical protein